MTGSSRDRDGPREADGPSRSSGRSIGLVALVVALVLGYSPNAWRRASGVIGPDGNYFNSLDLFHCTDGATLMAEGLDPYQAGERYVAETPLDRRGLVGPRPAGAWPVVPSTATRLATAHAASRPYLYPPTWGALLRPIARLAYPWQGLLWVLCSGLACGGIVLELGRLARALQQLEGKPVEPRVGRWLLAGALLAISHSLDACLRIGQVNLVLLYLILLGHRLVRFGPRPRVILGGGVVWALAASIKVWPIVPALALLWLCEPRGSETSHLPRRRWGAAGLGLGLLLWLLLVPGWLLGWRWNLDLLGSWAHRILLGDPLVFDGRAVLLPLNQPLLNALRLCYVATHAGVAESAPLPAGWALAARGLLGLAALATLATSYRLWRRSPYAAEVGVSLVLTVALLASPSLWLSACVLLLPFYLAAPLCLLAMGRRRWALGYATVNWLIPFLNGAALSDYGLLGLGTTGLLLVFCISVLWPDQPAA